MGWAAAERRVIISPRGGGEGARRRREPLKSLRSEQLMAYLDMTRELIKRIAARGQPSWPPPPPPRRGSALLFPLLRKGARGQVTEKVFSSPHQDSLPGGGGGFASVRKQIRLFWTGLVMHCAEENGSVFAYEKPCNRKRGWGGKENRGNK